MLIEIWGLAIFGILFIVICGILRVNEERVKMLRMTGYGLVLGYWCAAMAIAILGLFYRGFLSPFRISALCFLLFASAAAIGFGIQHTKPLKHQRVGDILLGFALTNFAGFCIIVFFHLEKV